jgi:hypothetical protein
VKSLLESFLFAHILTKKAHCVSSSTPKVKDDSLVFTFKEQYYYYDEDSLLAFACLSAVILISRATKAGNQEAALRHEG